MPFEVLATRGAVGDRDGDGTDESDAPDDSDGNAETDRQTDRGSSGDGGGTGETLYWYLYPNTPAEEGQARNEVLAAVESFADRLYESDVLAGYEVNLSTEFPESDTEDDPTADAYMYDFYGWVDENFGGYAGIHLGITGHTNFANAERVGQGETAFRACTKAFVGTAGGYANADADVNRYQNLAIQEPGHLVIVEDYHDLDGGNDHDLGQVTADGTSTPMITFYENGSTHPTRSMDRSGTGECAENGTWDGSHTMAVSDCTVAAVRATMEEETGSD